MSIGWGCQASHRLCLGEQIEHTFATSDGFLHPLVTWTTRWCWLHSTKYVQHTINVSVITFWCIDLAYIEDCFTMNVVLWIKVQVPPVSTITCIRSITILSELTACYTVLCCVILWKLSSIDHDHGATYQQLLMCIGLSWEVNPVKKCAATICTICTICTKNHIVL